MNGRCLFQAVVCLMSFLLDFSAAGLFWTLAGSTTFCFWTKSVSNGRTHYMFLHQTGEAIERSLVLFDSIWNKENSLVDCITSSDQAVTESYESKCWEAGGRPFTETPDGRFNISELVDPAGPCVAVGRLAGLRTSVRRSRDLGSVDHKAASIQQNSGESSGLKLRRTKRAWMIPGTLWCGAGNKALNFSDLGLYEETDKCCREHDHCTDTITSFGFNYGVFNTNIFTLSHCDCDIKFRRCLHRANDSMSNMVGYGYFNILKMRCFEFSQKMQCAKRTWWGMCKLYQLTKYALVKDATYYNSTSPELEEDMQDLVIYHTISAGNHTFTTGSAISSMVLTEVARTASGEQLTVSGAELTSSTANAPELDEGSPQTNSPLTQTTLPHATQNKTTDFYKDLDSCHHQIPAMQEKYGLRNSEFTTLYHCNCTFAGQEKADDVHFLLLDFVSQFCFILRLNCTDESKDVARGRPLVASKRKAKRFNSKRSKRKDSSFRLYKKCLRMHSKLQKHREISSERSVVWTVIPC
uniref:phospholipase A2 n=1 Tax=Pygocentrus nattereri TaxID=42514 RepID=A0A3B4CBH8_PYGNA